MRVFGKSPINDNFVVELTPEELDAVAMMFAEDPEEVNRHECEPVSKNEQKEKQIDRFLNGVYQPVSEKETMSTADSVFDAYNLHKISKDEMIKLMNKIGF